MLMPFSLRSPNVVNYTLRDCMIVRCCAPVAVGEELSINYLGRSSLTPLAQRQEELEACYGFKCNCRRYVGFALTVQAATGWHCYEVQLACWSKGGLA
jgi:hypothetical protein